CLILASLYVFFVNTTATTVIYSLSLHDALPICTSIEAYFCAREKTCHGAAEYCASARHNARQATRFAAFKRARRAGLSAPTLPRSEEHTSELQSRENLVCRLLLEKKKNKTTQSK